MPPGLSMYKSRPSPCYPPLPGGGDSTPQPYKRREVKRFWKLFSRRVLGDRGRPGQSSAPFWSPNPAARGGSESEDCVRALRAATPPRPQALLRRQGETSSATPRVPVVFLGTGCWEGAARRMEEKCCPGRRMAWEVPPLQLTSLPHPHPSAASKLAV